MSASLTIAIPTYNRASWLNKTLESLVTSCESVQGRNIEVIVIDNASNDETQSVVDSYINKYNYIRYIRRDFNIGGDPNIVAAYNFGFSDYNYVLGDDDCVYPETIKRILYEISFGYDVIIMNRCEYNDSFEKVIRKKCLAIDEDKTCTDKNDLLDKFDLSIGMISGLVVRRGVFKTSDVVSSEDYYVHLFMMYKSLGDCIKVRILSDVLVSCRLPISSGIKATKIVDTLYKNYSELVNFGYKKDICFNKIRKICKATARSIIKNYKHCGGSFDRCLNDVFYSCKWLPYYYKVVFLLLMLIPPFVFKRMYKLIYGNFFS